jgi:hypothetical protein
MYPIVNVREKSQWNFLDAKNSESQFEKIILFYIQFFEMEFVRVRINPVFLLEEVFIENKLFLRVVKEKGEDSFRHAISARWL